MGASNDRRRLPSRAQDFLSVDGRCSRPLQPEVARLPRIATPGHRHREAGNVCQAGFLSGSDSRNDCGLREKPLVLDGIKRDGPLGLRTLSLIFRQGKIEK
jgi:hypothetical protein